jgi:hypothetical protein
MAPGCVSCPLYKPSSVSTPAAAFCFLSGNTLFRSSRAPAPWGRFAHKVERMPMSDLTVTKQLDEHAATFLRFAGPDNFVIEVNGAERIISREFWRALPHRDASEVQEPSKVTLTG